MTHVVTPQRPQAPVVLVPGGRLTRRGHALALIVALLIVVATVMLAVAAGAVPLITDSAGAGTRTSTMPFVTNAGSVPADGTGRTGGGLTVESAEGAIVGEFDGPTVHLDWRGNPFVTFEANFIGERVIVPGDRVHRTLRLQNDGPGDAVLTVWFTKFQEIAETTLNPGLARDVTIFWEIAGISSEESFAALYARALIAMDEVAVAEVQVGRGEAVAVTIGVAFGADITTDYRAGEISALLYFNVNAHMQGELDTVAGAPPLPVTGARVIGLLALTAALVILGWLLVAAARRRRCEVCGSALPRSNRDDVCEGSPLACQLTIAMAAAR